MRSRQSGAFAVFPTFALKMLTAEYAKTGRRTPRSSGTFSEINMVEELEQEYAGLKDKVRDLREYL